MRIETGMAGRQWYRRGTGGTQGQRRRCSKQVTNKYIQYLHTLIGALSTHSSHKVSRHRSRNLTAEEESGRESAVSRRPPNNREEVRLCCEQHHPRP